MWGLQKSSVLTITFVLSHVRNGTHLLAAPRTEAETGCLPPSLATDCKVQRSI
jgi:hypothetical protein